MCPHCVCVCVCWGDGRRAAVRSGSAPRMHSMSAALRLHTPRSHAPLPALHRSRTKSARRFTTWRPTFGAVVPAQPRTRSTSPVRVSAPALTSAPSRQPTSPPTLHSHLCLCLPHAPSTELMSGQLELLRMATGTQSRVVGAMTMLKRRLFQYVGGGGGGRWGCMQPLCAAPEILRLSAPHLSGVRPCCCFVLTRCAWSQAPGPHFRCPCAWWRGCDGQPLVLHLPAWQVGAPVLAACALGCSCWAWRVFCCPMRRL